MRSRALPTGIGSNLPPIGAEDDRQTGRRSVRSGIRAGVPVSVVAFVLSSSFGLIAEPLIGPAAAIGMSVVVFAGAAQFAAITVLAAGGDVATAIVAGALLNSRFIPMSLAMTPSMPPGRWRRVLLTLGMTDPGWALSARSGGRFDAHFMVGVLIPQYVLWQAGTVFGVAAGGLIGGPDAYGLDVVLPVFFLSILVGGELRRDRAGIATAALGGLIALILIPVAPPGLPLIMASLAALAVLVGPWRETAPEGPA